jgi:type II secretory pathway pseudopilin PulG
MTRRPLPNRGRPSEEGYVLVALIFMLAILILSMAIAIPRVRASIQRDREIETMQRGKQYIRAVQLYYRKFNAYPPNVDALVKTNNIRFLRNKYVDPTTGKDVWKPVLYGQNKTPQAVGFFGQPLAGSALAATGPGGGNGVAGGPIGTAGNGAAGSGLFNSTSTSSSTDAGTGAAAGTSTGTTGGVGATTGTDSNGNPVAGGGANVGGASGTTGSSSFGGGQSFGGAGIIGFSPGSTKQSILVYKKKNHYNEWEFLYSPLAERQQLTGGNTGTVGQPAGSTTTPIGGGATSGGGSTTGGGATTPPASTGPTAPSSSPQ